MPSFAATLFCTADAGRGRFLGGVSAEQCGSSISSEEPFDQDLDRQQDHSHLPFSRRMQHVNKVDKVEK